MSFLRPLGLLLALSLPSLALGSTGPLQTITELARGSDRVVLARVLDSRVRVPEGNVRQMTTLFRLEVLETYQGKGPAAVELVQVGGKSGLWESRLAGDATVTVGETALFFLRCPDPKAVERCALVGLAAGKQTVTSGAEGARQVQLNGRVQGGPAQRPLEAVIDEIRRASPPPAKQERGKR
ncbi:hypothetical protein [Hyalangium rubrum]|uniref:Uncharacterized protein n=1 Tax=Hyalangium rubrum TaxID=3103134 RepID=A0ABU5GWF4_9BACT|nr:hypothetical protein [Hyalangium sp. s54d21]MDY7225217.1 hypothetical protein [Hyalangium sp. s54d21]